MRSLIGRMRNQGERENGETQHRDNPCSDSLHKTRLLQFEACQSRRIRVNLLRPIRLRNRGLRVQNGSQTVMTS